MVAATVRTIFAQPSATAYRAQLREVVRVLERLDLRRVLRRATRLHALVDVGALDPLADRVRPVAQLLRDPLDRPVLGAQLTTQLANQPHRLGLLLLGVPDASSASRA